MGSTKRIGNTLGDLQTLNRRAFLNRHGAMVESLESRRLLSAGELDPTFSGDGKLMTDLGTRTVAAATAVQSDGKILVAGTANGDAVLIRYNTNGTLDTSFDGDGWARLSSSGTEHFSDLEILPDGKIIVGGNYNSTNWWLARYRTNGTLDAGSGFGGTDGIQTGAGQIQEVELQGTKIITGGGDVIRRHNSNGSIDTTFGSGGSRSINASTAVNQFDMVDMEVGPNGKIVASGEASETGEDGELAAGVVVRLTSAGAVDTSFDENGLLYMGDSTSNVGPVAIGTDNLVHVSLNNEGILTVSKRRDDGSTVWGNSFSWGTTEGRGILELGLDSSARLLAVGSASIDAATFEADAVLARFNPTGGRDLGFGDNGFAYVGFDESALRNDAATAVAFTPGGDIVIAGLSQNWVDSTQSGDDVNLIVARVQSGTAPIAGVYIENRVLHVDGTAGSDQIDLVTGSSPDETLVFFNAQFFRFDNAAFDRIEVNGRAGNDNVQSSLNGPEPVTFLGGDGNDYILVVGGASIAFVGGAGTDIYETNFYFDHLAAFDGGTGTDWIIINGSANIDLNAFPGVENAAVESGNLTGNALNNSLEVFDGGGTLLGGAGDDVLMITGTDFAAYMDGGDGDDQLLAPDNAISSSFTLLGGAGNDLLRGGGETDDTLDGGAGNDTLDGQLGSDFLKGGIGLDTVDYSSRTANLGITLDNMANDGASGEGDNVSADIETIFGGSGNDFISANGSNNVLRGNGGNDLLRGFDGNDALYGGPGNDRLEAGRGNDYLQGNAGNDALLGQGGTDYFLAGDGDDWLYARDGVSETVNGGNGFDRAQRDPNDSVLSIESFIA